MARPRLCRCRHVGRPQADRAIERNGLVGCGSREPGRAALGVFETRSDRRRSWAARSARARREAGFTLLELTIAMIFVGLLAAGIVITISTAMNVWSKALRANEINQEARSILELLTRDVRDTYLGSARASGLFAGGEPVDVYGDLPTPDTFAQSPATDATASPVDTLELTTGSSSAEDVALLPDDVRSSWDQQSQPPVTDAMLVRWVALGEDVDQPAGLYRERYIDSAGEPQVDPSTGQELGLVSKELISSAVESLHYQYFDGENWWDNWDTRAQGNTLPQAVSIQLVLNDAQASPTTASGRTSAQRHTFETIVSIAAR